MTIAFVAAWPTAHTLAYLRIAAPVTEYAARLATDLGGLTPDRAGFAPAGRQTRFHDFIASSILPDQPAWSHLKLLSAPPRFLDVLQALDVCVRAVPLND